MRATTAALALALAACATVPPAPPAGNLTIQPPGASTSPLAQQVFRALLGASPTGVTWALSSATCGTVSSTGTYTPPPCPTGLTPGSVICTVTLTATYQSLTANVLISVQDMAVSLALTPYTAPATCNISPTSQPQAFVAVATYSCGGKSQ